MFGGSHPAVGLHRRPQADQVGSGLRERQVGSGATHEGVQDSAFAHVLQVAQVLTQVLLRGVALQGHTRSGAGGTLTHAAALYLLGLVLRDVVQGAVRVQPDPHHPHREFGRPLVGLQLGGWKNEIDQSRQGEAADGKTTRAPMDFCYFRPKEEKRLR